MDVALGWILAALTVAAGVATLLRRRDRDTVLPIVGATVGTAVWNVGAAYYLDGPVSSRVSAVYLTGVALAVSGWVVIARRLVYRTWRPGLGIKAALLVDPLVVGASVLLPAETWRSLYWTDRPWRHEQFGILYDVHNPWCIVLIAVGAAALIHHIEQVHGIDRLLAGVAIVSVSLGVGGQMTGLQIMAPSAFVALATLLAMWVRQEADSLVALAEDAERDPVTGAMGRAGLDSVLHFAVESARIQEQPLSVMVIDIDDFKGVNDQQGHMVGDEALRHVTTVIRSTVGGIVGRFGGDEFVVILPGTDIVAAHGLALRVVRAVSVPFTAGGELMTVTVSVGVADYDPSTHASPNDLLVFADRAMYSAKRSGGDGFSSPAVAG